MHARPHTQPSRLHAHARSHGSLPHAYPSTANEGRGEPGPPTYPTHRRAPAGGEARGPWTAAGGRGGERPGPPPCPERVLSPQRRLPGGLRAAVPLHLPVLLHPPRLPALPAGPHQQHPVQVRPRPPATPGASVGTPQGRGPRDPDKDEAAAWSGKDGQRRRTEGTREGTRAARPRTLREAVAAAGVGPVGGERVPSPRPSAAAHGVRARVRGGEARRTGCGLLSKPARRPRQTPMRPSAGLRAGPRLGAPEPRPNGRHLPPWGQGLTGDTSTRRARLRG